MNSTIMLGQAESAIELSAERLPRSWVRTLEIGAICVLVAGIAFGMVYAATAICEMQRSIDGIDQALALV